MSTVTSGTRVLGHREARLGILDQQNERHWEWGNCWCKAPHGNEAGLTFVAPAWDESRKGEKAW